jgi:hypothetical protein
MTFASMLQQESSYFDRNKVGELTSLLSTNPGMMRAGMTTGLASMCGGVLQFILTIVFMNHQSDTHGEQTTRLFNAVNPWGYVR